MTSTADPNAFPPLDEVFPPGFAFYMAGAMLVIRTLDFFLLGVLYFLVSNYISRHHSHIPGRPVYYACHVSVLVLP
jgi:hypothetical protein